jgi:hypothetical protein
MDSQTRDGSDALPRRKRCLPLLELRRPSDDDEVTCDYSGQPWNATTDEASASRGAIAEPGRKEGCYAIRIVCQFLRLWRRKMGGEKDSNGHELTCLGQHSTK